MADCSYSRCIQQKRNIRRELQRWTKNMVYIVGLERIAEELMGRRKWKLYQDSMSRNYLQPLNNNVKTNQELQKEEDLDSKSALHRTDDSSREEESARAEVKQEDASKDQEAEVRLKDWSPQSKCYFCVDGKLDSDHNNHGVLSPRPTDSESSDSPSDTEAPPTLTPPAGLLNNHRNMTTIENIAANIAAVAALAPGSTVPPLPFYPHTLHSLQTPWYLSNATRNFHAERMDMEKTGEQPLDLSSKPGNNVVSAENKMPPNMRLPTLDTKHIIFNSDFRAKPRMPAVAGRRTYTEDELQAALRDIQSGKLGTRRAAVIYGIPRSTLRNKVYKLALERERESILNSTTALKLEEEEAMDDDKELSGAEEEKEVEKALQGPLLSMDDILRLSNTENKEALRHLLKGKEESWSGLEHSAVGPYIQNLLLQSGGILPGQKPMENDVNPMLREVLRKIIVEEKLKTQQNNGDNDRLIRPHSSNSVIMRSEKPKSESDMETEETPSNVILKIPSFKPTTSKNGCDFYRSPVEAGSLVSPPVTSESGSPPVLPVKMTMKDVKDVIAKSISHKFQQSPDPIRHHPIDLEYKRTGFTPPMGGGIPVMKPQPELTRSPYPPPGKPPQPTSTGGAQGGKGTRPKRGKYRNYDRDSLVEAVRAVQRGEMSVHRAGSYYGVPHSTLEYKVKERHLMRPRKRDPKPNPVDEKIASLKQNDLRNSAAEKMKPVIKAPQKFPPTSPNGMKIPMFDPNIPLGYGATPFPFWPHPSFPHIPIDYGRTATSAFPANTEQFFASQMMQKLQEDSRTHSTTNTPSTTPNSTPTLAKNARQIAESLLDGSGANGSFLDGIIRSSLESGVPLNEDKSPKEERNVAPENMSNKALLDQLCRNSRLTPLPKVSEPGSSGDESYRKCSSPLMFASGSSRDDQKSEPSPKRTSDGAEIHTIELSNDSNESLERKDEEPKSNIGRIYLKTELTKPENLKPEKLIRFNLQHDVDRNGIGETVTGSASDTDAAQD